MKQLAITVAILAISSFGLAEESGDRLPITRQSGGSSSQAERLPIERQQPSEQPPVAPPVNLGGVPEQPGSDSGGDPFGSTPRPVSGKPLAQPPAPAAVRAPARASERGRAQVGSQRAQVARLAKPAVPSAGLRKQASAKKAAVLPSAKGLASYQGSQAGQSLFGLLVATALLGGAAVGFVYTKQRATHEPPKKAGTPLKIPKIRGK